MKFISSLAIGLCVLVAVELSARAEKRDVDIKSSDGTTLKATYFFPGKPGPAILLFHQCNMDRHAWDSLANDLVTSGFHVLAFDLRGFGETGGVLPPPPPPAAGRGASPQPIQAALPLPFMQDAEAAYAYLLSQKDVDKTRVAAGGASCGVELSTQIASRHREVKALMLLSGGTNSAAKAYIAATPSLAVFGSAAERDPDASDIRQIVAASKNSKSALKMYAGTEHGVAMFGKNPELKPLIVKWLQEQLSR